MTGTVKTSEMPWDIGSQHGNQGARTHPLGVPDEIDPMDDLAFNAAAAEQQYAAGLHQYETSRLFAEVFGEGKGVELLQKLRDMTIEQPCFVAGLENVGGSMLSLPAEQQGFMREGQNSIIRHIEAQLDIARAGPPKSPQSANTEPAQGETS